MATPNIVPRANGEGSIGTITKHWDGLYTNNGHITNRLMAGTIETSGDVSAGGKLMAGTIETSGDVSLGGKTLLQFIIQSRSTYYARPDIFKVNKTVITIPKDLQVNIGGTGYYTQAETTVQLSTVGNAAARAGKDVYLYACQPASGTTPVFVLSLNSTVPSGYTADNSRKIGGFHCLCVDVGTISGHTLSGYAAGDIIPNSQWDLLHRAVSANEGMVWIPGIGKWVDIYLCTLVNGKLASTFGGIIADGASSIKFNGEKFAEELGKLGKRLLWRDEFIVVAKGSNEETNIAGSTDPNTAGGHKDTAGRRMISNYGLEDCCGVLWQWLADVMDSYNGSGTSWNSNNFYLDGYSWQTKSVYNPDIDDRSYGSCLGLLRRVLAGAGWADGSACGSRASACRNFSSRSWSYRGCRGASEPRVVNL